MRHPHGVAVQILDGHETVVVDSGIGERIIDHKVTLSGGEGIVRIVRILSASNADHQMIGFRRTLADDVHVPVVKRLETADHQRVCAVIIPCHAAS